MRIVAACLLLAGNASAQHLSAGAIETLPAFLEKTVPAVMAERRVPGAAIAIVHRGRIVYLRGFGVHSLESNAAVEPATAFRVGSVSKFLTAVAALKLVDANKLDLTRNISDYLPGIALRSPTTTHQLLTHTAGFDERFAGAYTETAPLPSLADHLRLRPPQQVLEPGHSYSYSNYNFAVAGAVIEAASGQTFEGYLAQQVFAPLGMTSSSARQPPDHAANVAIGYRWDGSQHERLPARFTFASPSGGVTASAADMARLMIDLLPGESGHSQLLSADSIKRLFDAQYTPHTRIPAASYGALHWRSRGRTFVFKDGTLGDQIGTMLLDPGGRVGIFIASNALPGIEAIVEPLLTHLYGADAASTPPSTLPGAADRAAQFTGVYRDLHRTRNDLSSIWSLMPAIQTRVTAGPNGSIQWSGRTWLEIEPRVFQQLDRQEFIAFDADETGRITDLRAWGGTYERIGFFEQTRFHLGVIAFCGSTFVVYLVLWMLRFRQRPVQNTHSLRARQVGIALTLLNIAFVVGLVLQIRDLGGSVPLPLGVTLWLTLPMIAAVLAVIAIASAVTAWRREWWPRSERAAYSALAVGSVTFTVFLSYWKLLGFNY